MVRAWVWVVLAGCGSSAATEPPVTVAAVGPGPVAVGTGGHEIVHGHRRGRLRTVRGLHGARRMRVAGTAFVPEGAPIPGMPEVIDGGRVLMSQLGGSRPGWSGTSYLLRPYVLQGKTRAPTSSHGAWRDLGVAKSLLSP